MSESEWLGCADPYKMLEFVREQMSDRQVRLFACACCRRIWRFLDEPWMRHAVATMEALADGEVPESVFEETAILTSNKVHEFRENTPCHSSQRYVLSAIYLATRQDPDAVRNTYNPASGLTRDAAERDAEMSEQCRILHDIVGDPFSAGHSVATHRNDAPVKALALSMYRANQFLEMPRFADALEQAGCTETRVLRHCRETSSHVRGCWVIDLFLDYPKVNPAARMNDS